MVRGRFNLIHMSTARIKETFVRLPRHTQMIAVGGLLLAVATFLPWYADLDAYKIGDEFLGITGPAKFVGVAILLLSAVSLWIFSYHLTERRMPKLPVREAIVHLFVAGQSLFLLILVNSIYFDPKFGVNITLKESRFGMTMAFIAAMVLLVGAYLKNRDEVDATDEVGRLEPLIKVEETRQHSSVTPRHEEPRAPASSARRPITRFEPSAWSGQAGQSLTGSQSSQGEKMQSPKQGSSNPSGSFMVRMDL